MKHARILIIEDDADTADMLKIFFSSQGSRVETAPTGKEALSAANENPPDLILLDILLPDMDGYDVCMKLRSSSHTQHIPILFLTQKNTRSDILSGLEIGADDYLTKPFDLEELKLRVRNALHRSRTYRQIDARTSLPTGDLIRSTLSRLLTRSDWAALLVRISDFERQRNASRLLQQDELLGRVAARLEHVLRGIDERNPFVGYLSGGDFLLITQKEQACRVQAACSLSEARQRNAEDPSTPEHKPDQPVHTQLPLESVGQPAGVALEVGLITADDGPFSDVAALLDALFSSMDERNESSG